MGCRTNELQFQVRVLSCQTQLQEQHWKQGGCHDTYWWENHSCCWEARQHGWYHQRIWESAAGITWGCYLCRVIGVRIPADQSAQQATSLPSTLKDQISGLQQKDAVEGRLKYYLDLEKEPYAEERKQDTQLVSYLDYTVENDFCCLGLCAQCGGRG